MQKTPTGKHFLIMNFFPKRHDGHPMSGHSITFDEMMGQTSRTPTQNNGVMSSLFRVISWKNFEAGDESSRLYSDARSFSIKELFTIFL